MSLQYNPTTMTTEAETYICVDVETAGPIPGDYSMLSIGACTVFEPRQTFYIELQPTSMDSTEEATAVHQLSLEKLRQEGMPPRQALTRFEEWLKIQTPAGQQPYLVAFNAAFDWMFVNYYFMHFLGHNPFGHTAIDIKAYYMGLSGSDWSQTSWRYISPRFKTEHSLTHHALQDALDQADMFKRMLEEGRSKNQAKGE